MRQICFSSSVPHLEKLGIKARAQPGSCQWFSGILPGAEVRVRMASGDNLSGPLAALPFTLESCLEELSSFRACAESKFQLLKLVSAAAYVKKSYRLG